MRVGVLSDSHGFTGRLSTILMVMEAGVSAVKGSQVSWTGTWEAVETKWL